MERREYLFTESIIGLSLGFNEVVAIKNLILETLPQARIWNGGNKEGFVQIRQVLVCIVFLCFASFAYCKSSVLIMHDLKRRDLFICTWETSSVI